MTIRIPVVRDYYFDLSMVGSLRASLTKPDQSFKTMKDETRLIICYECWRAADELVEFWDVKVNIIEERCRQQVELRGIDPSHEFLEVFVDTFEGEIHESGKDRASWRKWRSAFEVGIRFRGSEFKMKC